MGAYRGALSGVRPDDLAAHAIAAVGRAHRRRPRADRRRLLRRRQPGRRGQPRRGADGGAARRPAGDASPARPSTGSAPRAWRRSTAPPARSSSARATSTSAGGVESMSRAPWVVAQARARPAARPADDARHDPRLAPDQPADGRARRLDRVDGRDRRERRRALRDQPRGPGRLRACAATSARSPPPRPGVFAEEIVPIEAPKGARDGHGRGRRGPAPRRLAGEDGEAAPRLPRGRHGHRRQRLDPQRRRRLPADRLRGRASRQLGAEPLARVVSFGVAGVDPAYMGIGPVVGDPARARRRRPRRSTRST